MLSAERVIDDRQAHAAEPLYLSLVIPAYNESRRILDTLQRCIAYLQLWTPSWEMVIVDDGSTDDTASRVESISAADPRVRLIRIPHAGKGAAVRAGMLEAEGLWRFFADADLAMDLAQLPRFFEVAADVAIASREAPGSQRIGEPLTRHLAGRVFNWCVRLCAVHSIQDTQCGYKLFTADAADTLFRMSRLNGFAFDVELLYLAQRAGLTILEVPIVWRHRSGTSVRVRTGIAAFFQLLAIRWNDVVGRYDRRSTASERSGSPV
jgi:glycosyltransferase involved in cell wall biosynthesis